MTTSARKHPKDQVLKGSINDIEAEVHFLSRDPLYREVKPYSMRFKPIGEVKQTNLLPEKHSIKIRSIREPNLNLTFDKCGFDVIPLQSNMAYEDFRDVQKIAEIYAPEIRAAVKARLKAQHVFVMDYAVRRRHPDYPVSTGENYEAEQPTSIVHIDFTQEEASRMLQKLYGNRAHEVLSYHWQVVNVWKPLKGPVRDWPLAVCDAESFNFEKDGEPGDIVYKDWVTENVQVNYASTQRWYWLPEQTVSELIIFKSADSDDTACQACPHTSFFNSRASTADPPRESIDCRTFVLYADSVPPEVGSLYGNKN
ncbi:hypothetical protein ONS95_006268 [Cadophora gregata]|uniref:uncharacterized protein n=1 Tax=Cadophora gregata TaxID=51156 RepID=UPI0026DBF59C|nr:uncharacterized protein ONS95_006268 [Cadophora gregata]KAK0102664.1 hypothetical protein ONS95_006268 [Cadophora gregata]KAK0104321.1 hypothetical protein ONS96_005407 [Cadophora gregata f. sp. sojae]